MSRLAPLLLLTLACGGPPSPGVQGPSADDFAPSREPAEPAEAAKPEDRPPEPPEGSDAQPAPEPSKGEALLERAGVASLAGLSNEALPAAVQALDDEALTQAFAQLGPQDPAYGFVALRMGHIARHRRDFRRARDRYAQALEGAPAGPAATALKAAIAGLDARRKVRPNRIGALLPLSGPYAPIGKAALQAVRMALAHYPNITLVIADTAGDADRAPHMVRKLVIDKHVGAIVGPIGAIESAAAARAAEALEVPLMSLSAAENLTALGTFVFRHRLTRSAQARSIARFSCKDLGLRRFAILYPKSDYGQDMMRAFWDEVVACGGEIRGAEGYSVRAKDFNEPIKRLIGRYHLRAREPNEHWAKLNRKARDKSQHVPPIVDFEALFIPDGGRRLRLILPFLAYWDIEVKTSADLSPEMFAHKYAGETPQLVQILGGAGFNDPRFARRVGQPAHNAVFVGAFRRDRPEAGDFVSAWERDQGRTPPAIAAHAFDAAHMLARAAADKVDRAQIRRALLGMRDHAGIFGRARVRGDGEVELDLEVLTIHPGGAITRLGEDAPGLMMQDEDAPPVQ